MENLNVVEVDMDKYIHLFEEVNDGGHLVMRFPNGYGASVICNPSSYGGDEGLFELAVVQFMDEENYKLVYDTPITGDVRGYLTKEEVFTLFHRIKNLPPATITIHLQIEGGSR